MNNIESYFDAPIFEGKKSVYAVRYESELELKLMRRFENESRIKSYFQPILTTLVKDADKEFFINVDFLVEYISGRIDLVYLETEIKIPRIAKIIVFTNPMGVLKPGNFGFVVISENNQRRVSCDYLKLNENIGVGDYYFVNFSWVN